MKWNSLGWSVALFAVAFLSCYPPTPLRGQARFGTLKKEGPIRAILFPSTCIDQGPLCEQIDLNALTGLVAKELEFRGYTIVDGATLVREARSRDTAGGGIILNGQRFLDFGASKQSGSLYDDLPPDARRALLAEAHADGTIKVRLSGLGSYGFSRTVELQIRLGLGQDELPGWTTRCVFDGSPIETIGGPGRWPVALERGLRCALEEVKD